jgi:hypothetical protein|tara:strand:+ start:25 stop:207 length:183 start_codon:yes stop_codon:yes gene_type:complete
MFITVPKQIEKIKDPEERRQKMKNYIMNYGDPTGLFKDTSPMPKPKKKIKSLLRARESST